MIQVIEMWKVEQRRFLSLATLFIVVSIIGFVNADELLALAKEANILAPFEDIMKSVNDNPTFTHVFSTIFINNFYVSFTIIALGLFFGVGPIISIIGNGLILGAILQVSSSEMSIHPLWAFFTMVLPHGILELPAVIFAAAVGLHFGWLFIQSLRSLFRPEKRTGVAEDWRRLLLRLPLIISVITVFLLVAGVIESILITVL